MQFFVVVICHGMLLASCISMYEELILLHFIPFLSLFLYFLLFLIFFLYFSFQCLILGFSFSFLSVTHFWFDVWWIAGYFLSSVMNSVCIVSVSVWGESFTTALLRVACRHLWVCVSATVFRTHYILHYSFINLAFFCVRNFAIL